MLAGWAGWLLSWLAGWLAGWLLAGLADWLAGWLTSDFIDFHGFHLFSEDFMRFHGFQGSGVKRPVAACGALWRASPVP